MSLDLNDPRLTAYALNELDPQERAEVERLIADDPVARELVKELKETADFLGRELAAEPAPELTDAQKEAIRQGRVETSTATPAKKEGKIIPFPFAPYLAWACGLAAVIAIWMGLSLPSLFVSGNKMAKDKPRLNEPKGYTVVLAGNTTPAVPLEEKQAFRDELKKEKEKADLSSLRDMDAKLAVRGKEVADSHFAAAAPASAPVQAPGAVAVTTGPAPAMTPAAPATPSVSLVAAAKAAPVLASVDSQYSKNKLLEASTRITTGASAAAVPQSASTSVTEASITSTEARNLVPVTLGGVFSFDGRVSPDDPANTPLVVRSDVESTGSLVLSRMRQKSEGNVSIHDREAEALAYNSGLHTATASIGQLRLDYGSTVAKDRVFADNGGKYKYNVGDNFSFDSVNKAPANNESYKPIAENEFQFVEANPLSTFSIDVDTASYANMRRFLDNGQRPPADAVRIEELVNYFPYNYEQPKGEDPFAANVEMADCPWDKEHRLVRIGLKGREIVRNERTSSNLVFLIDVSGSMNEPDKLPLVKRSLQMLTNKLTPCDHIAIVIYAGESGLALPSTAVTPANKAKILDAIEKLNAGGSTNGGEGIQLAYKQAQSNFIKGGVNRVILCTDGDFNVGVTSQQELVGLIEERAKSGIFLSVLGFGTGNIKDSTMMMLADKGNGNYAYIDSLNEGRKVLVEQMGGTLVTIAKDVKIQVEFNPAKVGAYRLIGYEKRMLAKEDFNNDKKDAGEIGSGHTVTALYEIVPPGKTVKSSPGVDPLKYQKNEKSEATTEAGANSDFKDELLTLKIRYKQPDGKTSRKLEFPIKDNGEKLADASRDFKFASAVAAFGMILRDSPNRGEANYDLVLKLAREGKGEDEEGYRAEFIRLLKTAAELP